MMNYFERQEWINARVDEYLDGEMSEPVFRACLFGKGKLRGEELSLKIRETERRKYERTKAKALPQKQHSTMERE